MISLLTNTSFQSILWKPALVPGRSREADTRNIRLRIRSIVAEMLGVAVMSSRSAVRMITAQKWHVGHRTVGDSRRGRRRLGHRWVIGSDDDDLDIGGSSAVLLTSTSASESMRMCNESACSGHEQADR